MNSYQTGYNKGYADGQAGRPYTNPYNIETDAYDGYLEGHDVGEDDRYIEKH